VVPTLRARGDAVTPILARGPLPEVTRSLMAEHGTLRVLDVRRPKSPDDAPHRGPSGTLMGLGALLLLAFD
jgi:hypothetical protein